MNSKTLHQNRLITIHHGDCRDIMPTLSGIGAVITDPPYGIGFMGKDWDNEVPGQHFWELALECCLPGANLLAFGGTKKFHRLACAIEDAGWELRDTIHRLHEDCPWIFGWAYGSGFPKSMDVSKAIDKAAGAEREVIGDKLDMPGYHLSGHADTGKYGHGIGGSTPETRLRAAQITAPTTDEAKQWDGWGTALKPAIEPAVLARKPLTGTVAANVLEHGVGAINIDTGRIPTDDNLNGGAYSEGKRNNDIFDGFVGDGGGRLPGKYQQPLGRWPANLIHDGSESVKSLFPQSKPREDSGSAARFFYAPKASTKERNGSKHPTVKPIELMKYIIRLLVPPGQIILDPFCGSGSTLVAAKELGYTAVGIELDCQFANDAANRTNETNPMLF